MNSCELLFVCYPASMKAFSDRMEMPEDLERTSLENDVALAAALTDADRIRIFRDLLRTAEAIQRTKTSEQLLREEEVRRELDEAPGRQRYLQWIDLVS